MVQKQNKRTHTRPISNMQLGRAEKGVGRGGGGKSVPSFLNNGRLGALNMGLHPAKRDSPGTVPCRHVDHHGLVVVGSVDGGLLESGCSL